MRARERITVPAWFLMVGGVAAAVAVSAWFLLVAGVGAFLLYRLDR